jgi:ABC-type branched-subunit amino acid transport system ATPase component
MSTNPILRVESVHVGYVPGVEILRGLSFAAQANALTLVVGPNGAGKSTLLRAIFGFLHPHAGRILLRGEATTGLKPSDMKAAGVSYVPQEINSFPQLTVEENLQMGAWVFRRDKRRIERQLARIYATFPVLFTKRNARAVALSGGEGRMLSVAREMMTQPSLLLVDEPTVGLAPNLVGQVYEILLAAKAATGAAILLVEQNVAQALPLADYLVMLNLGRVKTEGPGRDFDNERIKSLVQECLLG